MKRRLTLRVALALPFALASTHPLAADSQAKKSPPASQAAPSKPAEEVPPIFDTEALAEKQFFAIQNVCLQSNRRMLAFFGTNDCVPCRTVNRAVFAGKFYEAMIKQFVPLFIDVTPGTPNVAVMKKLDIDPGKGLPGVVIIDDKGYTLEVLKNGEMAEIAKKGDAAVQAWILARLIKTDY